MKRLFFVLKIIINIYNSSLDLIKYFHLKDTNNISGLIFVISNNLNFDSLSFTPNLTVVKKLLFPICFILILLPFNLFGQNNDTTCICGNHAPHIQENIIVEEMANYPVGIKAFKKYLISTDEIDSTENGEVTISFIISCSGNTCGFEIQKNKGTLSVNTVSKIIKKLKNMDTWKPAKQRGRAIDIPYKISLIIAKGKINFINTPV